MRWTKVWVFTFLFLSTQACSSYSVRTQSFERPLSEVLTRLRSYFQGCLEEVPDEPRGYACESLAITKSGRIKRAILARKKTLKVHLKVVGNERPYFIEVQVKKEGLYSKEISQRLAEQLESTIQGREEQNLIDHFRAF